MLRKLLLMLVFAASLPLVWTAPAQAQANRAVNACVNAALRDFLILRRVVDQRDLRDKRGRVFARQVVMDMSDAGRQVRLTCTYQIETGKVRLERSRPGGPVPGIPGDERLARNTCIRAVKDQRVSMTVCLGNRASATLAVRLSAALW